MADATPQEPPPIMDDGSSPLSPRVQNMTCRLPAPPPVGNMNLERAYPEQRLERPLWFGFAPGDVAHRFVLEQGGRVRVFNIERPDSLETFLDLNVSRAHNEEGLLGMAFHPNYQANGRVYVYYSSTSPRRSVISEFKRDPDNPLRTLRASERILMEVAQPFGNHNGGDMQFGPDGYLYISFGDGGAGGDPLGHGQRTETLLGTISRIDIDGRDAVCGLPYGIPEDNPFASGRCEPGSVAVGAPEVWAWGLRNVWRMSFDRSTGQLWGGDVGQGRAEEVDIIEGGQNYGWNPVEGDACYRGQCDLSAYAAPIHTYGHSQGKSITGGYVYRGSQLPELWGSYVFGDYESGRLWALDPSNPDPVVTLLSETDQRISSFGEQPNGELIVTSFDGGLMRLVRGAEPVGLEAFPERLSQTGCFADTSQFRAAPGVIPYEVNIPFWSDGLEKERHFALPNGTSMGFSRDEIWSLPTGTVLMKTFFLTGADDVRRRIETRLIRKGEQRWNGFSYRWLDDQTDAVLLTGEESDVLSGPNGDLSWLYPSRAQCDHCHIKRNGYALGLTTRQLNREVTYGEVTTNQLNALGRAGYVSAPEVLNDLAAHPALNENTDSITEKARALLHVNCAMCHQPDGPADAEIDLRLHIPLRDMGLCGEVPKRDTFDADGEFLLAPGQPNNSVLLERMKSLGRDRMPPLGSGVIDQHGVNVIGSWIQEIAACP